MCLTLGLAPSGWAGKGSWNLTNKVVNLHLYLTQPNTAERLTFSTTNESKLSWWFNEASKKMWNATEGNLRLGTVYVYNKTANGLSWADITFTNGPEAASADVAALGTNGNMDFQWTYTNGNYELSNRFTQNSLVHEFGHYGFGLYDEYLGRIRRTKPTFSSGMPSENYIKNPQPSSGNHINYWGWNGGGDEGTTQSRIFYSAYSYDDYDSTNALWTSSIMNADSAENCTEFSWDGDYPYTHLTNRSSNDIVPGHSMLLPRIVSDSNTNRTLLRAGTYWVSNEQEENHVMSCWAVIAKKLGIENLTNAPSTAMPTGFTSIEWVVMTNELRTTEVVDRSASMAGYAMQQAREGAKLFASLAQEAAGTESRDFLGIVDLDNPTTPVAGIRELTDPSKLDEILAAIDTLDAQNDATPGDGLKLAQEQLESLAGLAAGEIIVLLSDGDESDGSWVSDALPGILRRGIQVHTISLGARANLGLMQSLADQTHGRHFIARNAAELPAIYAEINGLTQEAGSAGSARGVLAPGAEFAQGIAVNTGAESVTFVVTSETPGLRLRLRTPAGAMLTSDAPGANAEFMVSGVNQIIRVRQPAGGVWTPMIAAPAVAEAIAYGRLENPAVAIPDDSRTLVRTLYVTNNATINSVYPSVAIAHPFIGDLRITLKSPRGTAVVLHDHTGGGQQVLEGTYGSDRTPAQSLAPLIGQPMRGLWQLILEDNRAGDAGTLSGWGLAFNSAAPPAVAAFDLLTSVDDAGIRFVAGVESALLDYPTPAMLSARVSLAGKGIGGANVTAVITHPDGETRTIVPLYDNGDRASGDRQVWDGIYSGKFASFTQNGTYQAMVVVNCTSGVMIPPSDDFTTNRPVQIAAPQFVRQDTIAFVVTNIVNPTANAVQISTLSLYRRPNNVGNFTVAGQFNALDWQYDPKADDVSLALDGYQLAVPASQLVQRGRNFTYTYVSPDRRVTRYLTITPYVGGTSKCAYSLMVNNDNLAGINYSEATPQVDFSFAAGRISDSASLLVTVKTNAAGSWASYQALASGELEPALYVESAIVKFNTRVPNTDQLQLLAGITGWSLPANLASVPVTVGLGGFAYTFPAGSLVKQRDTSYRATLDGGNVTLLIAPAKRRLQLLCKNQRLAGFVNPAEVKVVIADQAQVARIMMGYNERSASYSY
jgi:subtilisin-like proprotein convertase family protein